MPKMKTNRGAAKRFKQTATGRFKRHQSHRRHILTKKSRKRKRHETIHRIDLELPCVARERVQYPTQR